ncbi:hypothetical protein TNIN_133341 [Trichonephila inaurata madagascariensis]|uniref:Uncharacterized protein n=1 Tax=Trichonephila inaurata madagascariensis TaxID=2747483 RepID=A0A8X7CMP0_9ARAC|nr:hypothetical protein TNIN_133341 [Trichonephila inaurata madagascariensis]
MLLQLNRILLECVISNTMDGMKQTYSFTFSLAIPQTIVLFLQRVYGNCSVWEKPMGVISTFLNLEILNFEAIIEGPEITPETLTST